MRSGSHQASLGLENHRGVCRLVVNTLLAQRRWDATADMLTEAAIVDWAISTPVETLKQFFANGHYGVDELEALVEIQLRASA